MSCVALVNMLTQMKMVNMIQCHINGDDTVDTQGSRLPAEQRKRERLRDGESV